MTDVPDGGDLALDDDVPVDDPERKGDTAEVDEQADAATSPAPSAGRAWTRQQCWLASALLAASVIGLVVALVMTLAWRSDSGVEDDRQSALAFGDKLAEDLVTIDYNTFAKDVDEIKSMTLGKLTKQIERNQDAQAKLDRKLEATRKATVKGSGVVRLTGDTARVIVALDSTVKRKGAAPQQLGYRIEMELKRAGDGWKASIVEFIP
jgi:Mce-associated membrane protein